MVLPLRSQQAAFGLPEILVQDSNPSDRFHSSSNNRSSSFYTASHAVPMSTGAMPIPNAREPVPPPLPPPRRPDVGGGDRQGPDLSWRLANARDETSWGSVKPGSSLYGGHTMNKSPVERRADLPIRSSPNTTTNSMSGSRREYSTIPDEGYASLSGTSIGSNKFRHPEPRYPDSAFSQTGFQSSFHDKYTINAQNAEDYDKKLLQKLNSRRGPDNMSPPRSGFKSVFSSPLGSSSPTPRIALEHRHPSQLKPLSLPILTSRPPTAESPLASWSANDTPLSSAISAISPSNPFPKFGGRGRPEYRSPADTDSEVSPVYVRSTWSSIDDAASIASHFRESFDRRSSPDHDIDFQMEDTGFKRLHIMDEYPTKSDTNSPGATTGQKRLRASSPMSREEASSMYGGSASDARRRESGSRFHSKSNSISSTASGPRSNSYASTYSLNTSITSGSITSFGPGRISPGGHSPGSTEGGDDSPFVTSLTLNTSSPQGSISGASHQRKASDTRPLVITRKLSDNGSMGKLNAGSKMHGMFMCDCCPKKPKKFDSQEELNAHEQEKQYACAYCANRFKNKNEAERHQNSLHLRRHSWSCAALSGCPAAFHPSSSRPGEADTCGYCGEDFPRSGISSPSAVASAAVATEQDWETRILHLQEVHKFGECNQSKKFFRADHFRQHLKHSHAGTGGKWTNMLENSCMKDEPLPEPIRGPERINSGISSGTSMVEMICEEDEIL